VHDSQLDHSIMKRDASSRKGNSGGAKAEASLKLPAGYANAELSVSAVPAMTDLSPVSGAKRTISARSEYFAF
jgi:hypothetical protein